MLFIQIIYIIIVIILYIQITGHLQFYFPTY